MSSFFTRTLLEWHRLHPRILPWAEDEMDPYRIWLSEIIMQQTRIEQGAAYFKKFADLYPTVFDLASASLDEVMRHWQGLGYYTRARNLHKTALTIAEQYKGIFPDNYEGLIALPGIGPYSAAAIASFAYELPHPVIDGNVKRLVARFDGMEDPVDESSGYARIESFTSKAIRNVSPGEFNQAIMNFGAVVCKPKPLCHECPLSKKCFAFQHNVTDLLPVKAKKLSRRSRSFHFIIILSGKKILMQRRLQKDIWQHLFTPPLIEKNTSRNPGSLQITSFIKELTNTDVKSLDISKQELKQELSHQTINARFHSAELRGKISTAPENYMWVTEKEFDALAKPRIIIEAYDRKLIRF